MLQASVPQISLRRFPVLILPWILMVSPLLQAQELVRFVTCPVYRDTQAGRKSGCWLADDPATGIRYDITPSPSDPDWNFGVLVEGRVAPGDENPCGGKVLDPVRVSILPGVCTRFMLPAEGFPGRPFSLPERNVAPVSVPREVPPGPYETRSFYLFFDFDKDFLIYQFDDYLLDKAITWIRAANPRKIVVTGYAAASPEAVSGEMLAEDPAIARKRAEKLREALIRLGVPAERIEVKWDTRPDPIDAEGADGLPDPSLRRVEIKAIL